ncbi:MAG TPA: M90 family metallopeptidase [Thermodesulfovibrionales bacterium]|nr:M90 family metallopeptidase [Thermodesulfovibrionales bacterium]
MAAKERSSFAYPPIGFIAARSGRGRVIRKLLSILIFPFIIADYLKKKRREAIGSRPFPRAWLEIIRRNITLYGLLAEELQDQLLKHVQIFLAEKRFEGCRGLRITDEIRVTIAAQACFLLLNREATYYPKLRTILVYPGAYLAKAARGIGPEETTPGEARLGESWRRDYVVLSWDDVRRTAADLKDGHNLVLHEFAHQVDEEHGATKGASMVHGRSHYATWARVLSREYEEFCRKVAQGEQDVVDAYGAASPAEFFAVLTEAFFEKPNELKEHHPGLYDELRGFYRVDPGAWTESGNGVDS